MKPMTIDAIDRFVRKYAARLNTDKKIVLDHPEEWDFRGVSEAALPFAIEYEYFRENTAKREAACAWLESKVNGKTVRSLLLANSKKIRVDMFGAIDDSRCPLDDEGQWFAGQYPLFPLPWQAMEAEDHEAFSKAESKWRAIPPIHALDGDGWPDRVWNPRGSFGSHLLQVDLSTAKTKDILATFEKWLRAESKKHKRQSGKASALPWQKLKWLSARRLAGAGLTYIAVDSPKGVNEFIKRHRERAKVNSYCDVLPVYGTSGGWYDALKMAERELSGNQP
jgi:hypothetical protein